MNHSLYYEAIKTDDAWHDELVRLFGNRAGDIRYTRQGTGLEGSTLRTLHDAAMQAGWKWFDEQRKWGKRP